MKKKIAVVLLLICTILCLCGCDSTEKDYNSAEKLFESGEYKEALELYSQIGDYEDSVEKIAICEKEIAMRENADYDFLEAIEKSVLGRMTASDNEDYANLVNTELVYLEEFQDRTFYDEKLHEVANKYIEGLYIQKDSLSESWQSEHQIKWQRGLVCREEALKELYEQYDFMKDNTEFVASYISDYEDNKSLLVAYETIDADIDGQLSSEEFQWTLDEYEMWCIVNNNTDYEFSTVYEISFYNSDGIMFESTQAYIPNIKPHSSYKVSEYISDSYQVAGFEWNNYYTEVIY